MATGSRAAPARMIPSSTLDTASTARTAPLERLGVSRRHDRSPTSESVASAGSDRILRRMGLAIGIAGVIVGIVELPEIADQSQAAPFHWTVVAVALAFGWYPVLALVSLGTNTRAIVLVARAAALSYLAAIATVPLSHDIHSVESTSAWLYRILALCVFTAGLGWRTRSALAYLVVGAAASACINIYVHSPFTLTSALGDFSRAGGLGALFVWCIGSAKNAAARVDRESELASTQAAAVAGAAARDRERSRFAALIHDAVLSTLLDASRGANSEVLRRQAERTLRELDESRSGDQRTNRLDARSAIGFLRSAVHEVNPGIDFTARRWPGFDDLQLPVEVAGTIAAALSEAARNSLRHAGVPGRKVRRSTTVTVSAGGIRVVFTDDGAGFDLGSVPPDRLGVSVSILGRMRRLSGAAGFVESQPGEGTTVTLVWGGDGRD
ncbi:sensor histidine kinase [Nocardia lijiangensis]|uniref:sensor histidine kinase n=1 Tax=Nocardia lijiangensis TaxID=299618 RepID=UPI003D736C6C